MRLQGRLPSENRPLLRNRPPLRDHHHFRSRPSPPRSLQPLSSPRNHRSKSPRNRPPNCCPKHHPSKNRLRRLPSKSPRRSTCPRRHLKPSPPLAPQTMRFPRWRRRFRLGWRRRHFLPLPRSHFRTPRRSGGPNPPAIWGVIAMQGVTYAWIRRVKIREGFASADDKRGLLSWRLDSLHRAAAMSDHRLSRGRATIGTARTRKIETVGRVITRAAVTAIEARTRLKRAIRAADHLRALFGRACHRADVRSPARAGAERSAGTSRPAPGRSAGPRARAAGARTGRASVGRRTRDARVRSQAALRRRRARCAAIKGHSGVVAWLGEPGGRSHAARIAASHPAASACGDAVRLASRDFESRGVAGSRLRIAEGCAGLIDAEEGRLAVARVERGAKIDVELGRAVREFTMPW
jgi:hypothetical protein